MAISTISLAQATTDCTGRTNCCDSLSTNSSTCPKAEFGDSLAVALVIGSDAYARNFGNDLGDLVNARNDAGTVGDALATQGFTVRYLFDPNRAQVEAELAGFLAYMKRRETTISLERAHAVVYFAGHGLSYADNDSGPLDYLVFGPDPSGVLNTEFLFENSRISTTAIERYFQTLRKFRIVYLFDACRTLTALQSTAREQSRFRGVRAQAFSARDFKSHLAPYAVIYTTESDTPAGDGTPSTGNGHYVGYLKRLLGLAGLEPSSIFHTTNFLVASDQVPQFPPPIQSRGAFLRYPWNPITSDSNLCLEFEKSLARAYSGDCHEGLNDGTCKAEICNVYENFRSPEVSQCPRGRLFSLLFEEQKRDIKSYCSTQNAAWNSSFALHDLTVDMGVPPPSPSNPESEIFRNTLMNLSTASNPSPFSTMEGPVDLNSLARMRLDILPDNISRNRGVLFPPIQRFRLRQLPREGDAPIFSHLPDGAWASLDCTNVPCGNGFLGISVEDSSGRITRGFARPEDVSLKEPIAITALSFADANASALNSEELEGLLPQIQSVIKNKGSIQIYYFDDPSLPPDKKFLNSARLLSVYHFIKSITNKAKSLDRRKIGTYLLPKKPGSTQGEISILFFDGS